MFERVSAGHTQKLKPQQRDVRVPGAVSTAFLLLVSQRFATTDVAIWVALSMQLYSVSGS